MQSYPSPLRIATRESPLALWQANHVAQLLGSFGVETTLVPLVSRGDLDMRPIDGTRQVGVFTKRIQQALIDDEADVAVHSLKDLPTEVDERLMLAAVPARETVSDCLVSPEKYSLDSLPEGACVGTGSKRRGAQLLSQRRDLRVESIRGNVQTRLKKLSDGEFDAIVLAQAGLLRLEYGHVSRIQLSSEEMLPAPGQGALGIEVRRDDASSLETLARLNHVPTCAAVFAERTLLAELHGGCLAPIAAHGEFLDGRLQLRARVLSPDGTRCCESKVSKKFSLESDTWSQDATELGQMAAEDLAGQGARELVELGRQ